MEMYILYIYKLHIVYFLQDMYMFYIQLKFLLCDKYFILFFKFLKQLFDICLDIFIL